MIADVERRYLEKHGFEALSPKAVLFDMDGVLYDSMPNHAIAWQEAMNSAGLTMTAYDAYATEGQRGPDTIRQMARQQWGHDISEEEGQRLYDEKARRFHALPEAPLMPGIMGIMEQIRAQGWQIGVVTGSGQRPLLERLQRDFGAFVAPDHIVTAYDVSRGKPHPDPYLMGLRKMGNLEPWQAVVVENAPLGVRASVAAGIFTIGVNTGILTEESLQEEGADLTFPTMNDLNLQWNELWKNEV